jgi:1,2-diacylglycerol 3-alpha-glucosyltransferase
MKIAAFTPVSGPYIASRYSAFATNFPDISLYLIELGQTSTIYPWEHPDLKLDYERVILSEQPAELQSGLQLFQNIVRALNKIQPDLLVVCGYGCVGVLQILFWSFLYRKPAILLSDSKADDTFRSWWREAIKALVIKFYRSALVAGQPQKRYLQQLGMQSKAIFFPYDVVGNQDFSPQKIKHLSNLVGKPYFLAINRFVPKKNLIHLIKVYANYRKQAGVYSWDLVLCGDGELRSQIEALIAELNLQNHVHLPGFLQHNELLPYFAHANCFIHASIQEQWGLVVNEAMAAGLPVLVSNHCGCCEDLVIEGINGFSFAPNNAAQLTKLMLEVSGGNFDLEKMGAASLEHIQNFSPDYFAKGLSQAVEYALASS